MKRSIPNLSSYLPKIAVEAFLLRLGGEMSYWLSKSISYILMYIFKRSKKEGTARPRLTHQTWQAQALHRWQNVRKALYLKTSGYQCKLIIVIWGDATVAPRNTTVGSGHWKALRAFKVIFTFFNFILISCSLSNSGILLINDCLLVLFKIHVCLQI